MDNDEKIKEYEAHKTPVPSFEEWQNLLLDNKILKQCQEMDFGTAYTETVKTKAENQQLKELLKECQHMIIACSINNNTFTKEEVIDIVKQIDNTIGEK